MPADDIPDHDKPAGRCPICGSAVAKAYRPFCSKRCADVDLSRWLRGSYAIGGSADDDEDGDDGRGSDRDGAPASTDGGSGNRTPRKDGGH